jgi:hypothetical protein
MSMSDELFLELLGEEGHETFRHGGEGKEKDVLHKLHELWRWEKSSPPLSGKEGKISL